MMKKIDLLKRQNKSKICCLICEYYVYITVFIISLIVILVAMFVNKCIPFGRNFPMTGNGFIQDYPQFCAGVRNIKDGKFFSLLDYNAGITSDNFSIRSYSVSFYLLRPILYFLCLLSPEKFLVYVFFLYYVCNYFFSGLAIVYYLTHRYKGYRFDKNDARLIPIGVSYVLSTYSICFFVYFFRYLLYIPLIFLGIEKLVYKNKKSMYLIFLAYYMATDAYYAFVLCIFSFLFFLTLDFSGFKDFLTKFIRFIIYSVFSAGLAAVFLVPYYIRTKYSPYSTGDSLVPSFFRTVGSILTPLSEFRFGNGGFNNSNIESRTNIYCGLLLLLLLPAYFFLKEVGLGTKIKNGLLLFVIYFGFNNQLLNYVFHGFHFQWQVPNRFSAFGIFMITIMVSDVIYLYDITNKKMILSSAICGICYVILTLLSVFYNNELDNKISDFLISYLFIFIYITIISIVCIKNKRVWVKAIFIILVIEVILSSFSTFQTDFYPSDEIISEINYYNNVIRLSDRNVDMKEPYVITERPRETSYQNMSYVVGTHSISYYTSSNYRQHFDLLNRWGVLFSKNLTYYHTGSPLADMILHVKYHTVNNDNEYFISEYNMIDKEGNISLYQNPYYLPLGLVFDSSRLSEWEEKSEDYNNYASAFERDNGFAESFDIAPIYNQIELSYISDEMTTDKNYYYYEEDESGNGLYTFYIGTNTSGKLFMQIAGSVQYIGITNADECDVLYFYIPKVLNINSGSIPILATFNEENFELLHDNLSYNTMYNQKYSRNSICGNVSIENDSVLYLAIPNIPGFHLYVDGNKSEIREYLDGIGVDLTSGEHFIELKFFPKGLILGLIITSITIFLLLIIGIIKKNIDIRDYQSNIFNYF